MLRSTAQYIANAGTPVGDAQLGVRPNIFASGHIPIPLASLAQILDSPLPSVTEPEGDTIYCHRATTRLATVRILTLRHQSGTGFSKTQWRLGGLSGKRAVRDIGESQCKGCMQESGLLCLIRLHRSGFSTIPLSSDRLPFWAECFRKYLLRDCCQVSRAQYIGVWVFLEGLFDTSLTSLHPHYCPERLKLLLPCPESSWDPLFSGLTLDW